MARMRTLKPGFFSNDRLAEIHPLGRLLFQGLWCMADREGRLEDRPKRIKAEILPYDNARVDKLLDELECRGFILRYVIDGARYIQIVNFGKHQNPHVKEPLSIIPAPDEHGAGPVPPSDGNSNGISSRARVLGHGIPVQEQEPVQEQGVPTRSESAAGLRVVGEPVPKPAKSATPVGTLLDKIKALDAELEVFGDQSFTGSKLKANPDVDLNLVAEAYVSFRHGEWPGSRMLRESGALAWVIGDLGGYVDWRSGRRTNGPPSKVSQQDKDELPTGRIAPA